MNLQKLLEYVFTYQAIELWDASNGHETIVKAKNKTEIPTKYLNCKIEPNGIISNKNDMESQSVIVISIITK